MFRSRPSPPFWSTALVPAVLLTGFLLAGGWLGDGRSEPPAGQEPSRAGSSTAEGPPGAGAGPSGTVFTESQAFPGTRLDSAAKSSVEDFVGPVPGPAPEIRRDTLHRNDSIYLSLRRQALSNARIVELNAALDTVFDPRTGARPGDCYELITDTAGVIQRFRYVPVAHPESPVLVRRLQGRLCAERLQLPLRREIRVLQVVLETNLAKALSAAGETDALTDVLADDIFGSVIDFRLDPRRGDRVELVFEKLFREGVFVRYGNVLLARYEGQRIRQGAVRFVDSEGRAGYYDLEGNSLARAFLLYALPYRGITSHFNRRRFHPVLKRVVPHLGTDYAASMGTRVWATGRGRVIHAGWKGSLGKAVIVRHANGYVTRYGHLSRILVHEGEFVEQKQLIGRVGATGRVTGPHLHYEILKNGQHLNPETINRGTRGRPLDPASLARFAAYRDSLLALLKRDGGAPSPLPTVVAEQH